MEVKNYKDIKEDMKKNFVALQDRVTDFNKGSVIDSMFDSFAREEEKKYIATRLGFLQNLRAIPYSLFGFKKKSGTYATGSVIFSRAEPKDYETIVAEGTIVEGGGIRYITEKIGVIKANEKDSEPVIIRAEETGSNANVPVRSIDKIVSVVSSDVVGVYNGVKVDGGCDVESDSDMLKRFNDYITGLQGTSGYGLKAAAASVDGVRSVNVVEDFTSGVLYPVIVYAEDGSGGLANDVKKEIQKVIEGDGTAANPGKRAPGINVLVTEPEVVSVDFEIEVSLFRADTEMAKEDIENNVRNYVNSLAIGENVVLTSVILILRRLKYVTDLKITKPADNILISASQVARFSSINVNVK